MAPHYHVRFSWDFLFYHMINEYLTHNLVHRHGLYKFRFRPSLSSASIAPALLLLSVLLPSTPPALADECHLTPVIHVLQYPGCTPKPIPSFACAGRCTSYVQVEEGGI